MRSRTPKLRSAEPKNTGEKRLLRDTMDDPEVLEALALLEEGIEERADAVRELLSS